MTQEEMLQKMAERNRDISHLHENPSFLEVEREYRRMLAEDAEKEEENKKEKEREVNSLNEKMIDASMRRTKPNGKSKERDRDRDIQ